MSGRALKYSLLPGKFAICRLAADAAIPSWALRPGQFSSISRTSDELSIVSLEEHISAEVQADRGWTCLKLEGPFRLSETGVLVSFIRPLSEGKIPVFTISSFDTDYVLIKDEFAERASAALRAAGHEMV